MKRMTRRSIQATLLWLLLIPVSVCAHHSLASYNGGVIELRGRLEQVEWRNPHTRFVLRTGNGKSTEEVWMMEGNSIYNIQRTGVTREMFRVGDQVTVAGNKSTREDRALLLTNVLLPDGRELLLTTQTKSRWSTKVVGGRDVLGDAVSPEQIAKVRAENKGIFRVWTVPRAGSALGQLATQHFTATAIAARKSWDPQNNFTTRCEPEGMPRITLNPHPFEFLNRGKDIVLRTELYDIERTIHMDRPAPPPGEPPSRLGYSVGAWDNGALVVKTSRINWPYFDTIGTPLGPSVEVVERFALSQDQSRIDFTVTVTDPKTFTEPAVLKGYWLALGDKLLRYNCQAQRADAAKK
jgi:hypothetical protein